MILAVIGVGLCIWLLFAIAPMIAARDFDGYVARVIAFGAVYAFAAWIAACVPQNETGRAGQLPALLVILGIALAFRAIAFTIPHDGLTTDAYRYVWDARVQLAGFNPYAFVPAAPELAALRDTDIYPLINQKERAVTIYPPVAQMVFAIGGLISDSVLGQKIVLAAAELMTLALVWLWLRQRGLRPEYLLIYAWHPLPIIEIWSQVHIDAAAVLFMTAALVLATARHQTLAAVAIAAGTMTKLFPLVLLPAIWRRFRLAPLIAFAATCALLALPYWLWGFPDLSGYLGTHLDMQGYTAGWGFHPIWMLRDFQLGDMDGRTYTLVALAILALIAGSIVFKDEPGVVDPRAALWLAAAFVWLTSPHYPWYFLILIPLLAAAPSLPVLLMTILAPALYLTRPPGGMTWTEIYAVVYYAPLMLVPVFAVLRRFDVRRPVFRSF